MLPLRKTTVRLLGELLIERRVITKKDLDRALELQKEKGGMLGEILRGSLRVSRASN